MSQSFVPLASLVEQHLAPTINEYNRRRMRRAVQWFRFHLGREPSVADFQTATFRPFYDFCASRGLTRKTITHYRKALVDVWDFAHKQKLIRGASAPSVPARLNAQRSPAAPGSLEHFFEFSFRASIAQKYAPYYRATIDRASLFVGRDATVDDLAGWNEKQLGEFRDFAATLPRRGKATTRAGAEADVNRIRRLRSAAKPELFPPVRRSKPTAAEAGSLRQFFEKTYRPVKLMGKSKNTADDYAITIARFERFIGADFPLSRLDDDVIGRFVEHLLAKKLSRATINKNTRSILAVLRFARRRRETTYVPDVELLREYKREPDCWTLEEFGRILAAADQLKGKVGQVKAADFWRALILFVYNTGARISAVMATPAAGLDLQNGHVLIPAEVNKQKADQRFDLLPETVAALRKIRAHTNDLIFDDWQFDRQVVQWPALNNGLRMLLRQAGLSSGRRDLWHKIRRTFATMVASRQGVGYAQTLLGHSCLSVTQRYIDSRLMNLPSIRDVLPSAIAEPQILRIDNATADRADRRRRARATAQ